MALPHSRPITPRWSTTGRQLSPGISHPVTALSTLPPRMTPTVPTRSAKPSDQPCHARAPDLVGPEEGAPQVQHHHRQRPEPEDVRCREEGGVLRGAPQSRVRRRARQCRGHPRDPRRRRPRSQRRNRWRVRSPGGSVPGSRSASAPRGAGNSAGEPEQGRQAHRLHQEEVAVEGPWRGASPRGDISTTIPGYASRYAHTASARPIGRAPRPGSRRNVIVTASAADTSETSAARTTVDSESRTQGAEARHPPPVPPSVRAYASAACPATASADSRRVSPR